MLRLVENTARRISSRGRINVSDQVRRRLCLFTILHSLANLKTTQNRIYIFTASLNVHSSILLEININ